MHSTSPPLPKVPHCPIDKARLGVEALSTLFLINIGSGSAACIAFLLLCRLGAEAPMLTCIPLQHRQQALHQGSPVLLVLGLALQKRRLGVVLETLVGGGKLHSVHIGHFLQAADACGQQRARGHVGNESMWACGQGCFECRATNLYRDLD
eukprot:1159641-Pelagomonas_calceolata.AAC.6